MSYWSADDEITADKLNQAGANYSSYTPAGGATATLDLSDSDYHAIQMPSGNITIALSNEVVGQIFSIAIKQDGTGSRTVTWFSGIAWTGGTAITLSTGAGKTDVLVFRCIAAGSYQGFIGGLNI